MAIKPWPHSPAVLARVEIYSEESRPAFPQAINRYYEVSLGKHTEERWTHERAVECAQEMKWLMGVNEAPVPVLGFGGHDQMGVT